MSLPDRHAPETLRPAPPERTRPAWLGAAGMAAGLVGLTRLTCSWIASSSQDALILRWLRVADDHPLRTGTAWMLLALALTYRPERPTDPDHRAPW